MRQKAGPSESDLENLGLAIGQLKKEIWAVLEPIFLPIVEAINKLLKPNGRNPK